MFHYAVIFFLISLIAAVFGFANIAPDATGVARILFFVFLILSGVSFLASYFHRRGPRPKVETEEERDDRRLARLQILFPIGREFTYLGLRMRVTGYYFGLLRAEYLKGGAIEYHRFNLEEAEVLYREQFTGVLS